MTGHFVSQERVDAEAAKTDVPKHWSIMVVTGPGVVAPPAAGSGRKRSRRTDT
jgi:hypothetical protein